MFMKTTWLIFCLSNEAVYFFYGLLLHRQTDAKLRELFGFATCPFQYLVFQEKWLFVFVPFLTIPLFLHSHPLFLHSHPLFFSSLSPSFEFVRSKSQCNNQMHKYTERSEYSDRWTECLKSVWEYYSQEVKSSRQRRFNRFDNCLAIDTLWL